MGSAAAPVEISSDEEDSGKILPAVGKRKTPEAEDALQWAKKILCEENCDAIGEGLDDSAAIQEFLESLMDATEFEVGQEKSMVADKVTARVADGGDDDDCVILDGDPDKAVAVAKEEGFLRDAAEDEVQMIAEKGELACRDFPHPRHLCVSLPFSTTSHASHCSMCHCYVCDSPAPCLFWGKGTMRTDHCHGTDKDAKWKKLRQSFKNKSHTVSKLKSIQNFFHPSPTEPSSLPSANVNLPSTGRFPVTNKVSQNQQVDPNIMAARNTVPSICLPRAPFPVPRTTMVSDISKRDRVAPPVYAPSNATHFQPSVPRHGQMQAAHPRASRTAQGPRGGQISATSFQSSHFRLRPLGTPTRSEGHQFQPASYPQLAPNTIVGTGVAFSRCTSLATQGTQNQQAPSPDTRWKDALANLAHELGVPDYNINQPLVQQSAGTPQSLHPNQLLAQTRASLVTAQKTSAEITSQMRPSGGLESSNYAYGGIVLSSGSVQAKQPLCQLNSQSSIIPSEVTPAMNIDRN